jgi:glycine cleavage system H protein
MSKKFTKDHEWIRLDGDVATVGITAYAQEQLGDVVFVEVPEAGLQVEQGDDAAVVESVKAASNGALDATPELVNASPDADGWFFKMTLSDATQLDDLMDEAAYEAFLKELG